MGDRKIGDLAIAFAVFIAVFGIFLTVIIAFDSASNNADAIGNQMLLASNLSDNYNIGNESATDPTLTQLQSVTFDNNTFQAPMGQFIDTRGISQASLIVNNNPSTIVKFLKGIQNLFPFKGSGFVWFLLISMVIITGIILILRFFQGLQKS